MKWRMVLSLTPVVHAREVLLKAAGTCGLKAAVGVASHLAVASEPRRVAFLIISVECERLFFATYAKRVLLTDAS